MNEYLNATEYFDYSNPLVETASEQFSQSDAVERVKAIYLWVRDDFPYNPYLVTDAERSFKASYCLEAGQGYCIPKAALMVAMCRLKGVPARIGLADVKNHLSTPKLDALLKSDIFSMHGYVEVFLNQKWVKATPAFNQSLCEKTGTKPLPFDGLHDSIFHPYTSDGHKHMEYINDYGCFAEMPVNFIFEKFEQHYPHLFDFQQQDLTAMPKSLESEIITKA